MSPPHCQQSVQSTPSGRDACRILLISAQIEVAGEEKNWWEHHGQALEGTEVLCSYQRGQESRWHGVLYDECEYRSTWMT